MKTIFFSLFLLIISTFSINAQTIGIVRNAQYRITANMNPIKAEWEKLLVDQDKATVLTDFTITAQADKITGKTTYMLLAQNRDKSVKVARALKMKAGSLVFVSGIDMPAGVTVCSGCSSCQPVISDGKWICDSVCPDGKLCEKSVTTQM